METKRWSELRPIVVTFGSTLRGSGPAKLPEGLLCPSCGAKDIAVILYGLPGITKELEKAIENRKITLGAVAWFMMEHLSGSVTPAIANLENFVPVKGRTFWNEKYDSYMARQGSRVR